MFLKARYTGKDTRATKLKVNVRSTPGTKVKMGADKGKSSY